MADPRPPSLLLNPPRPREKATANEQLNWLREQIRLYARDMAILEVLAHFPSDKAEVQLALVADGFADIIAASDDVIRMAIAAEQGEAHELIKGFSDQFHRRVFYLAREHAPGNEMIAAGEIIAQRLGLFVPDQVLFNRVVEIGAEASMPRRRRRVA